MRINYPKMRNMPHALSFRVFLAFKGTNFYMLIAITAAGAERVMTLESLPIHYLYTKRLF